MRQVLEGLSLSLSRILLPGFRLLLLDTPRQALGRVGARTPSKENEVLPLVFEFERACPPQDLRREPPELQKC